MVRRLVDEARPHLARLDAAIASCEVEIKSHVKGNVAAQRLSAITGVGPLTAAVIATVTDARDFKNGRAFAAWQGVVWAAAGSVDTDLSFLRFLERYRTDVAECRMAASRIVEPLDVIEHLGARLFSRPQHLPGRALDL